MIKKKGSFAGALFRWASAKPRGAWDVAKKTYPNQVLYLMDKSRIMERHPNDRSHPKVARLQDRMQGSRPRDARRELHSVRGKPHEVSVNRSKPAHDRWDFDNLALLFAPRKLLVREGS